MVKYLDVPSISIFSVACMSEFVECFRISFKLTCGFFCRKKNVLKNLSEEQISAGMPSAVASVLKLDSKVSLC